MSTPTPPPPPAAPGFAAGAPAPRLDVSATDAVPFARLVHAELRKSCDTRAGFWLLASIGILVALVEGFILIVTLVQDSFVSFEDFAFIAGGITSVLLPVLAIMLVTSEWSQRSALVSFALEPRRVRVVLAKLVVGYLYVVATIVAMLLIGLVFTLVCELAQPDQTDWELELGVLVGFGVFQLLTMTIGFAFAALLLNTPASIVVFFVYWYALPTVIAIVGALNETLGDILEWVNFQVAVAPLAEWSMDTGEEWGKLIVSGLLWIVVPLGAGLWRILRAEVK